MNLLVGLGSGGGGETRKGRRWNAPNVEAAAEPGEGFGVTGEFIG